MTTKWICSKCDKDCTPIVNIKNGKTSSYGKDLFSYTEIVGYEVNLTCTLCNKQSDSKWVFHSYAEACNLVTKYFSYCIFNKNIKNP
jgi:hypothetical protein